MRLVDVDLLDDITHYDDHNKLIVDYDDIQNTQTFNPLSFIEDVERNLQYLKFAYFVAEEICRDSFEDEAGAFAEIACRKLNKLGVIQTDKEGNWVYEFDTIVQKEIIQCKDCKRFARRHSPNDDTGICCRYDAGMREDDFCSYGEKKE